MATKNKSVKKIASSVIAIIFFVNNLAYGLAPGIVSGELRSDGNGVKSNMYAAGQKLFADKRGPGAIDFDKYLGQKEFTGIVPQVAGVRFVEARYALGDPEGWDNNELLERNETNLINALKHFRNNEAALLRNYNIVEGYFDVDAEKGELPISRWEFDTVRSQWTLVVHTDFVSMWNDIKKNDVWFEYTFPDGKKRTVSLAWAIFYRVAKHEMADLTKDRGFRFPKGGGIWHSSMMPATRMLISIGTSSSRTLLREDIISSMTRYGCGSSAPTLSARLRSVTTIY